MWRWRPRGPSGWLGRGLEPPSLSLLHVMIWWVVTTACGALMSCSEAGARGRGGREERGERCGGWQCCDGLGSSKFQSKQKKLPEPCLSSKPPSPAERESGPRPKGTWSDTTPMQHWGDSLHDLIWTKTTNSTIANLMTRPVSLNIVEICLHTELLLSSGRCRVPPPG